ncbi:oligosaccharide flippase family protein [Salinarimonas soli]|uniref:Oligosaccharide flippase family protein n=1 Tax=Salinarimonas soli TaxID=1638099 RepID=A0A5B2VCY5_9HYPH|nr:oligosaccharide flippase family protein [Salinarimonas soli]KAA2236921.1 oligosaccharide flippase family protein [Salinarimonas soli]
MHPDEPTSPPSDDGLRRKALTGAAMMAARQLVSIFLKLIGVVLITRYLGPERYGSYVAALGVYQFLVAVGSVGINIALLRHEGDLDRSYIGTATTIVVIISAILLILIELAMPSLAWFIGVQGFAELARWLFLALPLQLLILIPMTQIERRLDYKPLTMIEISGQVLYYSIAAPLIISGEGPVALVAAYLLQQIATIIITHLYIGRAPNLNWDTNIARTIISSGITFSLANWIWMGRSLVNPLIIGSQLGAYAVGIVSLVVGILEMLTILKFVAWRLTIAVIARFPDDHDRIRRAITQGMELQIISTGTFLLGFGWLGHWIVPIAFGERWLPALELYPYVAIVYLTTAPFNMMTATMSALGFNKYLAYFHVSYIVSFATAAFILVPIFGIRGYGLGEIAALPTYLLLHALLTRQIGAPNYRIAALWWTAAAIGLFWRELGVWAIVAPFAVLGLPVSWKRLYGYITSVYPGMSQRRSP